MDSHLETIPSVGSLTARRFSDGNSQDLGGDADWTSGFITLSLGTSDDLVASLLEVLNLSSLEGESKWQNE